jgi:hypothetical protein
MVENPIMNIPATKNELNLKSLLKTTDVITKIPASMKNTIEIGLST